MRIHMLTPVLLAIVVGAAVLPRAASADWPRNIYANLAIAGAGTDQELSAMVPDGSGVAYFAWTDKRGGTEDVYV